MYPKVVGVSFSFENSATLVSYNEKQTFFAMANWDGLYGED
jgi:hypothetical protein